MRYPVWLLGVLAVVQVNGFDDSTTTPVSGLQSVQSAHVPLARRGLGFGRLSSQDKAIESLKSQIKQNQAIFSIIPKPSAKTSSTFPEPDAKTSSTFPEPKARTSSRSREPEANSRQEIADDLYKKWGKSIRAIRSLKPFFKEMSGPHPKATSRHKPGDHDKIAYRQTVSMTMQKLDGNLARMQDATMHARELANGLPGAHEHDWTETVREAESAYTDIKQGLAIERQARHQLIDTLHSKGLE